MKKLKMLFVILLVLAISLLSLSCASFKISDYPLMVRQPANQFCFEVKAMSWQERTYSVAECDRIVARGIIITSATWKLIRGDIQKNCQTAQCKQLTGAADNLFLAIDEALQIIP